MEVFISLDCLEMPLVLDEVKSRSRLSNQQARHQLRLSKTFYLSLTNHMYTQPYLGLPICRNNTVKNVINYLCWLYVGTTQYRMSLTIFMLSIFKNNTVYTRNLIGILSSNFLAVIEPIVKFYSQTFHDQ